MNTDWNIQKRSAACSQCEKVFEDNHMLFCFINLQDPEETRKDYCTECWEETKLERAGIEFFSYWQTQYFKIIPVTKEEPVKRDQIELMLKKYIKSDSPGHINLCYILAVMLERKKILTHKDSTKDAEGKKLLIYENHKTGETFVITDPQLKLGQIAGVQQQVKTLLDDEMKHPDEPVEENLEPIIENNELAEDPTSQEPQEEASEEKISVSDQ